MGMGTTNDSPHCPSTSGVFKTLDNYINYSKHDINCEGSVIGVVCEHLRQRCLNWLLILNGHMYLSGM